MPHWCGDMLLHFCATGLYQLLFVSVCFSSQNPSLEMVLVQVASRDFVFTRNHLYFACYYSNLTFGCLLPSISAAASEGSFFFFLQLEEPDSERQYFSLQSEPKLLASTLYALEDLIAKRKTEEVAPGSKPSWTRRLQQDPKLLCSKIRYAWFDHLFLPNNPQYCNLYFV